MSSRNSERPDRIRASSRRRTGRPIDPAAPTGSEVICGKLRPAVKLRLYHHPDGARIAYREAGTGPALALLHSKGLTHREFEPVVDELAHRHRVVLPDLPLHGASEDRPDASVLARVADRGARRLPARDLRPAAAGRRPRPRRAARAAADRRATRSSPSKLVLLPNPMHTKPPRSGLERTGRRRWCASPWCRAVDRVLARAGGARAAAEPRRPADRHRTRRARATWCATR